MNPAQEFYSFTDEDEGNRGVWTDLCHNYFIAPDAASATILCATRSRLRGPPERSWTEGKPGIVAQVRTGPGLPDLLRRLAAHFAAVEPATRSLAPDSGWRGLPGGLCCRFAGFELEIAVAPGPSEGSIDFQPDSSLIVQRGAYLGQGLEWGVPHLWLGALAAHLDDGADRSE